MFEEHIKKWIERLSVKHSELSGFSICPFASKAKYAIVKNIDDGITNVVVLGNDISILKMDDSLTPDNLEALCEMYNKTHSHLDVWFLYDSFKEDNYVGKFKTGNGEYNIILIQPYNDLQKRSQHLKASTKYYDHWSEDYYNKIVKSRDERTI